MCFYEGDFDWYASVTTDDVVAVAEPVKCSECRRVIRPGEWRRHIRMQEHECCVHDPDNDYYCPEETAEKFGVTVESLPEEGCPPGCEHDYGETSDYDRCQACDQLIEAIHQHELSVGCREYESRPALEQLYDAMNEQDGKAYLAKAEELFPGITARLPADLMWFRDRDEVVEDEEDEA